MPSGAKVPAERDPAFILFGLPSTTCSLRGVWLLFGIYFGASLIAALISPWIYHLMQAWAAAFPNSLNTYLAGKRFPAYFDRIRWLPLLIGLPWLMRHCGLFSWKRLGYGPLSQGLPTLLRWFAVGAGSLAFVILIRACLYPAAWDGVEAGKLVRELFIALGAALMVSLLEETVFRGLTLRLFYTAFSQRAALWLAALFFAYTHFKMPRSAWAASDGQPVFWWSGFLPAGWTLCSVFCDFKLFEFVNLVLVGWVLGILFLRTRCLWACVGLHTGWVAVVLWSFKAVHQDAADANPWWLGSERIVDGGLATLLLLGMGLWLASRPAEECSDASG